MEFQKHISENYSLKKWTGKDDLHFGRLIRSPSETYDEFPLDNQEKEKDRFIQILRQVAKENQVDLETLIMLTITSILQSNNLSCRDQMSMWNLELQFDREEQEDPRFQWILRQDPDSEPTFQRILRQDRNSQKMFQRVLRQDPDLELRFERILRQDPDSEPRFQKILWGDEHLKHFQPWHREREQRATQGAWSPVGKRSEVLTLVLQFVENSFSFAWMQLRKKI